MITGLTWIVNAISLVFRGALGVVFLEWNKTFLLLS